MSGSTVDSANQTYHELIDSLSIAEKVRRSGEMARWAREWIGRQIVAEHGPMPERRLKIEVALRIYANEPEVVRQLKELLRDVSD
jgi:hypothetical protein